MKIISILGHCAELYRILVKSTNPSDDTASKFFRQKKYIGSSERRLISEVVFTTLRIKLLSEYCAEAAFNMSDSSLFLKDKDNKAKLFREFAVVATSCFIFNNFLNNDSLKIPISNEDISSSLSEKFSLNDEQIRLLLQKLDASFRNLNENSIDIISTTTEHNLDDSNFDLLSKRYSTPDWIMESWARKSNIKRAVAVAESFFEPAHLTMRTNSLLINRKSLIETLSAEGIKCRAGSLSPDSIILEQRVNLNNLESYKRGLYEVQDEGSQMIALAVSPGKDWSILDACAGAGGKSLHLATLQKDKGEIIATDIEYQRLRQIRFRCHRACIRSIKTMLLNKEEKHSRYNISSISPPEQLRTNYFDAVLVDAPCSGIGTSRRAPMSKYKLNPRLLEKLCANQLKILNHYSHFVRSGGILVYSTCSLMPQENEIVAEKFLADNTDFEPDSLSPAYLRYGIQIPGLDDNSYHFTFYPHEFGCDGFFVARFKRK
ncbi:MAG: hypothetical protein HW421_2976 [Ignavibacteria bacterium]|nr:hypothetical protein [Ignavibacteria bacterium]